MKMYLNSIKIQTNLITSFTKCMRVHVCVMCWAVSLLFCMLVIGKSREEGGRERDWTTGRTIHVYSCVLNVVLLSDRLSESVSERLDARE